MQRSEGMNLIEGRKPILTNRITLIYFKESIACLPGERDETARLSVAYGPVRVMRWAYGLAGYCSALPDLVMAERRDGLNLIKAKGCIRDRSGILRRRYSV